MNTLRRCYKFSNEMSDPIKYFILYCVKGSSPYSVMGVNIFWQRYDFLLVNILLLLWNTLFRPEKNWSTKLMDFANSERSQVWRANKISHEFPIIVAIVLWQEITFMKILHVISHVEFKHLHIKNCHCTHEIGTFSHLKYLVHM